MENNQQNTPIKLERTFKPVAEKRFDPKREYFIKFMPRYDGPVENLHPLVVADGLNDMRWNYAMPRPLEDRETIHAHPTQDCPEGYIRVVMDSPVGLISAVYSKHHFRRDTWPDQRKPDTDTP